jgi:hypothetical protein
MTRPEMLERLTIAMTCHLPMPDCKACRGYLGEIYDALKEGDPPAIEGLVRRLTTQEDTQNA